MDTTPVDRATAAVFEAAEARAWQDAYAAAPPEASDAMDTPSYEYFSRLGFTRPYVRTHWTRPIDGEQRR
jgi:hypothetical protein